MGRAYYGAYFAWFEVGRVELLRNLGATYAELEAQGFFLPVVEVHAKYLAPAKYDEELRVETHLGSVGPSRVEFFSAVISGATGSRLAEGRVTLACIGPDGRPKRLPAFLRERIFQKAGLQRSGLTKCTVGVHGLEKAGAAGGKKEAG